MSSKTLNIIALLTEGFETSCSIFFMTLIFALPLGLIISFGSMSKFKPLKWLTKTFVWIIRGTPLMLQLFVFMYAPGMLFHTPTSSRMSAVLLAFIINYAAYFSEIFRGGIESIPKGQYEACQVLGMTKTQTFFKVILMQVIKRILAPTSNEVITLVKDTSLARAVSVAEIIMVAEEFTAQGLIWPLFSTGIYFLVFIGVLTILFAKIEKKFDYYRG